MLYITSAVMGFALATDAFAAAVASGMSGGRSRLKRALATAFSYGIFQAGMTLMGYFTGACFSRYIAALDHWAAFALLLYIGLRNIYGALKGGESISRPFGLHTLLVTSAATSIDALAAGVSLALSDETDAVYALASCAIIGAVTLVLSFAGYYIGSCSGRLLKKKVEVAGGVILILLGVKILLEHLLA